MPGLGDLLIKVGANIDEYVGEMARVSSVAGKVAAEVESKFAGFERMGANMAKLGAGLSAFVTLPIVGIGTAAIEAAAKLEQTQIAFTHFLSSTQKAQEYLGELYKFAATTPFQIGEVTGGAQKLMAMGFAAKEVTPMLRILGDQLSAVGRTENMGQLILAFGEMKAKGVASMKEVRQMVTDGVIPAIKYMAEALGKSEGEVMDMMKKKSIDAATAINAIMQGMAANTGGMMREQMESFGAQMSNLKDNVTLTLKAIGDQLLPYGKIFIGFASDVLGKTKELAQWFGELPEPIKVFSLGLAGVAAAAGPLLVTLGGMSFAIGLVASGLAPIAALLGLSVLAFSGWAVAIGVAVAALAGLGAWVYEHWAAVKVVTLQAWDGISDNWKLAWDTVVSQTLGNWNKISSSVSVIWQPISGFFRYIWAGVTDYFASIWNPIASFLAQVWGGIAAGASKVWGGITAIFQEFLAWVSKIPGVAKLMNLTEAWKSAETLAKHTKELNVALADLGVGAQKTVFHLQTLAEKKADWAKDHQEKIAKLSKEYDRLSASIGQNGITQEKVAEAAKHLANAKAEVFKSVKETVPTGPKGKTQEEKDFTTLGIRDAEKKLDDFTEAFTRLRAAGSLTQNELIAGHIKLTALTEALAASTRGLTGVWAAQVPVFGDGGRIISGGLNLVKQSADNTVGTLAELQGKTITAADFIKLLYERMGNTQNVTKATADLALYGDSGTKSLYAFADAAQRADMMSRALSSGNADLAMFFLNADQGARYAAKDLANFADNSVAAEAAFRRMGITSKSSLDELAKQAKEDFEAIRNNSQSMPIDVNRAFVKMVEAAINDLQKLDPATIKLYENLKRTTASGTSQMADHWKKLGTEVSTVVTDFSRSIADMVFQAKSVGEAFTQLGKDIAKVFIRDAIEGILKTTGALEGMESVIASIGKKIAGVFGIGTSGGGGLSSIPGFAGGTAATISSGASAASGSVNTIANNAAVAANAGLANVHDAGKAASGMMGGLMDSMGGAGGLIQMGISAASGIVTGMQLSHIGSDVNFIEKSTRYAWLTLGGGGANTIVENTLKTAQYTFDIRDRIEKLRDALFDPVVATLEQINSNVRRLGSGMTPAMAGGGDSFTFQVDMRGSNFSTPADAARTTEEMARRVADMVQLRRGRKGPSL